MLVNLLEICPDALLSHQLTWCCCHDDGSWEAWCNLNSDFCVFVCYSQWYSN